MRNIRGSGGSSSSSSRKPIETPDSLHSTAYARVIDAISEGPILGLVNGLQSVFLDGTPLANSDDSLNFKNVQVDFREGTFEQEHIPGFPAVENEIGVSTELVYDTPWVRAITNTDLSAVSIRLSVPALSKADTSNGDILGHTVAYAIDLKTGLDDYVEVLKGSFTGKTTTKYERGHRIDLPASETGWTIRVRRLTPQANSVSIADVTLVESYTEIIDGKFRYPNTALCGIALDAEQFRSVPTRAFDCYGRILRVPSNYNAETREYTGIWDGTFQLAYTNNPAWVYYDLALHYRYGLGHLITDAMINKWALYDIARYCDELVPDGKGGMEPRFMCDVYLQSRAPAFKVMADIATVFRGISYWGSGEINAIADKPEDPVYIYNNANVIEGRFSYQGSGRKTRFTAALVSWNDLNDFGRAKIEPVYDEEGIVRFGYRETMVVAFGCSSQSQAHRVGKWILATSRYETQLVSFSVGLEGVVAAPGKIAMIADAHRAGARIGGRVRASTLSVVTVDAAGDAEIGDTINLILPDGAYETREIAAIAGRDITLDSPLPVLPVIGAVWMIQRVTREGQRVRLLSVKKSDKDPTIYDIIAIQHNESKFDFVENGEPIVVPDITDLPPRVQLPPTGIVVSHRFVATFTNVTTVVTVDWEPIEGAVAYEVSYRMNYGPWSSSQQVPDSIIDFSGLPKGRFEARVNAINSQSLRSVPIRSEPYEVPIAPDRSELPAVELVIVGGVVTVDCTYDYFRLKYLNENATVQFINVPLTKTIIIEVWPAGEFSLTMPSSVAPISGIPYVPTPVLGAMDVLGLTTINTGALWSMAVQQPTDGGGGVLGVSIAPDPAFATVETDGVTPQQPSVMVTATIVGGTAPHTATWTRSDGGGTANFLIDDPSSLTPTFSIASGTSEFNAATQTWTVQIEDDNGVVSSDNVAVTLERTSSASTGVTGSFDGVSINKPALAFAPAEAQATVRFTVRRDGTWRVQRQNPLQTPNSGTWTTGGSTVGDSFKVKFTGTGTGGFVNNGAVAVQTINTDRTYEVVVTQSFPGANSASYSLLVEIFEADGVTLAASGTVSLDASAEQA